MENPLKEIDGIVKGLVRAKDATQQRECLQKYYTENASFDHPMCAVASSKNVRKLSLILSLAIQVCSKFTSGFASCSWILLLRSTLLVRIGTITNIQPMMRRTSVFMWMQHKHSGAISHSSVLCWHQRLDFLWCWPLFREMTRSSTSRVKKTCMLCKKCREQFTLLCNRAL